MNKSNILILLPLLLLNTVLLLLSAQKVEAPDRRWLSLGLAHYTTYRNFNDQISDKKFRIIDQNELHLSFGSLGESVYLSYLTLELNTFYIDADIAHSAIDPETNQPFAPHETILIHETKRANMQFTIQPSVSFERRFQIFQKMYLSLGARIGYFIGGLDYYHKSTWGYGGNGIDQFERIESIIVKPSRIYSGTRVALLMVPEWRMGNWILGASLGFQYKTSSSMLHGETVAYRADRTNRDWSFFFAQEEIGFLTGLRISRDLR